MVVIWLLGVSVLVLYSWHQFSQIRRENELSALADGMCPRCHDGAYKARCRACAGTGSAEGFTAADR